jgi:putative restriction endonuclease
MTQLDENIRTAAFDWLAEQVRIHGEVLPRSILEKGFIYQENRVPLLGPQGIWKPKILPELPISIVTTAKGPYDDNFSPDGLLLYKYRGSDPTHRDNVGLRNAMKRRVPLVYFHAISPGNYLAAWPVFIIYDDPIKLTFTVAVDDVATISVAPGVQPEQQVPDEEAIFSRRAYITTLTRRRLHQQAFREKVLTAYHEQCACCRLRHVPLLDAAHIVPDSDPEGIPSINNGIALCKLHHAAFDSYIIGINPDYLIKVRPDILKEADGPMLLHGLQGMDGKRIVLPSSQKLYPARELLDQTYQMFKQAG